MARGVLAACSGSGSGGEAISESHPCASGSRSRRAPSSALSPHRIL